MLRLGVRRIPSGIRTLFIERSTFGPSTGLNVDRVRRKPAWAVAPSSLPRPFAGDASASHDRATRHQARGPRAHHYSNHRGSRPRARAHQ